MADKSTEYSEALATYRFYHDYRMKILSYTVAFNGALLAIGIQNASSAHGRSLVAALAFVTSVLSLGLEVRTVTFANLVWGSITALEQELGFSTMTDLRKHAMPKGIPQRVFVRIIYGLILVLWIVFYFTV